MSPYKQMLRHTLATLAYRAAKVLRDAPPEFAGFRASLSTRTPAEILAHMGDLMDWALSLAKGHEKWQDSAPLPWPEEVKRFFNALEAFDRRLASDGTSCLEEKLFQGPVADALTHTGQLTMLRRMAGLPVRGENYLRADITAGQTGLNQPPAAREFD